ncbi:hypothetical protein AAG570_005822 [Ranatra chinensis]|uniref:UBA domain-containing protein n=1 Tax=Ranatra chinensis TaxID=642074 RepID=A0ABD0XYJ4_9HEMI
MVVVNGERESGGPNLTVIANHPSPPAPAKIPSAQCDRESDGSSKMPRAERQNTGALCFASIKSSSSSYINNNYNNNNTISIKESDNFNQVIPSRNTTKQQTSSNDDGDDNESFTQICDYHSRWGIPRGLKLLGGGESSLTATAAAGGAPGGGWGSPPGSGGGGGGGSGGGGQTATGSAGTWNSATSAQQAQGGGGGNSSGTTNSSNSNNGPTLGNNNSNPQSGPPGSGSNQSQQGGQSVGQQQNQGGGSQQQQQQGASWAAAAGGSGNVPGAGGKGGGAGGPSSGQSANQSSNTNNNNTSTKQQMEQLNTMREALYSQDGWGGQNVNQDSNWDIPGSPEPGAKDNSNSAPVPMWKPTVNNGTDLWEANLRNGGIPPPSTQQAPKTAWGHTPSSNIGGMWGEDDDADTTNVWTGVPPAAPQPTSAPQWANQPAPIWPGGNKKEGDWGPTNWGDQRDPRDIRTHDLRQMIDPRDHMRAPTMDHKGMGGNDVLMPRDSRGSGRLNGASSDAAAIWGGGGGPHHHMPHHQTKIPTQSNQPAVNQWPGGGGGGGPPMKDMSGLGGGKPTTGWEEPSPPAQRRNMPNYDDGTSLWGPQHTRPTMPGQNKVSHWKEMPAQSAMSRVLQCPPAVNRFNPNMKPDPSLWTHPQRNGAWADGMDVGAPWVEDKPTPWMEQPLTPSWQNQPKHKCWDGDLDPTSPWVHPSKQPPKQLSKDLIWASKQFRMLTEQMGFKKDDVENALRSTNLNLEDALEFLGPTRSQRRHTSDLDTDHAIVNPYPSPQPICIPYQTSGGGGGSGGGGPNVLGSNNPSLSTVSPAMMQKLLGQQQQQMPFAQQSSRTQQTQQPSAQQLRMLVQQIQMAVQAGYLNQQILNQPLAPQTLLSLNQLLQHIRMLQQLMQQHAVVQQVNPLGKPNPSNQLLQLSVQITKTKQAITNLQNQIAAQQAVYVKQQQQQMAAASQNDFFNKSNLHDPLASLHPNFSDLSIKETQGGGTSQQSRLNQWKLPAVDKDTDLSSANEFSRAPGTTAKPTPGNSSPNINPLLGPPDRTWSSVNRNDCETGWPDSGADDSSAKDWPSSTQPSQAFSDLVPEFEPGKPWKGNTLKSIEDDPSLTPGSVLRSPLSLAATIKDPVLSSGGGGAGKASPTTSTPIDILPIPPLSLSSSASVWSFNPPTTRSS